MSACAVTKLLLPVSDRPEDAGIRQLYPIDQAAWIWHAGVRADEPAIVDFRCEFEAGAEPLRLHVSADQRYELYLDGQRIAKGPDRAYVEHWSFASYELKPAVGKHVLEARVWWLGGHAPEALVTWRGGFILKAEGSYDDKLSTGKAPWRSTRREGWSMRPPKQVRGRFYQATGDEMIVDGAKWFAESQWQPVETIRGPVSRDGLCGVVLPGWRLTPSVLPDQVDRGLCPGLVRAVSPQICGEDHVFSPEECAEAAGSPWQALIAEGKAVTVPANSAVSVVWDLDEYYCAFAEITVSGGAGSEVGWQWAESLCDKTFHNKGNRDEVEGKHFLGFGNVYRPDGGENRQFRAYWWQSGRYCLITVKTGAEPLTIAKVSLNETRYPLENEGEFLCSDERFADVYPLCIRVMQMCSHESYMDCPYYEQLMYVGDTRLEMLVNYMMCQDDRLVRRGIELFNLSKGDWGIPNERCPARAAQLSPTFALTWVWVVRDYALYRDDPAWLRTQLTTMRTTLEFFNTRTNDQGLLGKVPGWSFVDWVPEWRAGYPPGALEGQSSVLNLFYVHALLKAAQVEDACGEDLLAERNRQKAAKTFAAILDTFWDDERGLIADDGEGTHFSEHAQCLALLTGLLEPRRERRVLKGLLEAPDLARATVFFSHYLLETLAKYDRGDLIVEKFDFWCKLKSAGFRTVVEKPEPSRSDCHAWGAHPLFHMHASLLGIRPAAPGFHQVRIQPSPGPLTFIKARTPHPRGEIVSDLQFADGRATGTIMLPAETTGQFVWAGKSYPLQAGSNRIDTK
jgi:hypothetical protein